MSKTHLLEAIQEAAPLNKGQSILVMNGMLAKVTSQLATMGTFQLPGIGTFSVVDRAARNTRNPQTKEPMHIDPTRAIKFTASPVLKELAATAPTKASQRGKTTTPAKGKTQAAATPSSKGKSKAATKQPLRAPEKLQRGAAKANRSNTAPGD